MDTALVSDINDKCVDLKEILIYIGLAALGVLILYLINNELSIH